MIKKNIHISIDLRNNYLKITFKDPQEYFFLKFLYYNPDELSYFNCTFFNYCRSKSD